MVPSRRALVIALVTLPLVFGILAGCVSTPVETRVAGATDAGERMPEVAQVSTPRGVPPHIPPAPRRGGILFADEFRNNTLDASQWQARVAEDGGRIVVRGGYAVVEKGLGPFNASRLEMRPALEGDVVVDVRLWLPNLEPRTYVEIANGSNLAILFFRGSGETRADWNTYHEGWEAEAPVAAIGEGRFYVVRHVRMGDKISTYLLDGDTHDVLGYGAPRQVTSDPVRISVSLERGGSEFVLVDYVRAWSVN